MSKRHDWIAIDNMLAETRNPDIVRKHFELNLSTWYNAIARGSLPSYKKQGIKLDWSKTPFQTQERAKLNSKAKGEAADGAVLAKFLKAGVIVLKPMGDNLRYDLAIEKDGKFFRIQIKYGRIDDGRIIFAASACTRDGDKIPYKGQADYFAIYNHDLDKVYIIPVDECGIFETRLLLDKPKNGQYKGVRFACDFELKV